ncbi:MAG: hypothetical protein J6J21_01560 [Clostridia bacterium]|nr:hypothetical protein [Clostridia bacterium]
MKTKRFLALALGILMMIPLALNVFAYTTPYASLQTATAATSKLTISGSSLNFDQVGTLTNVAASTKSCSYSITDASGALHLNNTGTENQAYTTGNKGSSSAGSYGTWVSTSAGMTFDLYARFANLPKITSSSVMTDTGVVSGNPSNVYFSGLVFNLCSSEKYMADSSKSNNELQAVFAYYDNATLGTNTVLILPYGNRNAFASASAVCYFFNTSSSSYDRYTLTFDPVNKTTQFCINGVAQKANGTGSTTFSTVALCYRATATVNFLNINLNNAQAGVSANNGTYKANIYIDQLNVYPNALVPNTTNFGFEGDPVPAVENTQMINAKNLYNDLAPYATDYINPTVWNAFKGWIDYCYDIVESGGEQSELDAACTGTSGNWFMNRLTWLSTAGAEATTGGSAVTVAGTGVTIPAATPIVTGTDRIWISHSSYNGRSDSYGHHNASVLLTRSGMYMSEYACYDQIYDMALSDSWRAYVCEPTKATGYYQVVDMGYNKDAQVPEGGFILAFHVDGVANGSVLSSGYASVLFGNRNERAISACGIAEGDYVKLEGVTINANSAATLDTTGTWYCMGDPRITTPTTITRNSNSVGEYFNGFKSNAYMIEVDPAEVKPDGTIKTSVEGSGSISAEVNGSAVTASSFTAPNGATVTLTASGNNFSYWKNAKNNSILSTEAEFSFKFGVSELNIVAVFASTGDTTPTHTVTFKDSVTGKILGTTTVNHGETVPAAAIPEVGDLFGYKYVGFFAGKGQTDPIDSYAINYNTVFYARYKNDEAAYFNLTLNDGSSTQTLRVRYAKIVVAETSVSGFDYWTMDGKFYSSKNTVQVSMPNRDCTVSAVTDGTTVEDPNVSIISNFVDDNGNLMTTFVSDAVGQEMIERGILMTRKATESDLVVDTVVNSVTKGISSAAATEDVFGFIKSAITSKAGTWLVRGYIIVKNGSDVETYYSDVESIEVEGTGAVEKQATFVAMSHNMRNGNTSYSSVASNAAAEGADIVGIQEAGSFYYSSLKSAMENQGYTAVQGEGRGGGLYNEYNPIFFKTSKFILHNSGTFWLSDTPNTQSKYDGLTYYRICTWVVLQDRETSKFVQYFNTHLCATASTEGASDTAAHELNRFKQVKALLGQVEYIAQNCPGAIRNVLIGGDFNMTETHGVLAYLTGSKAYNGETNTITGSRFRFAKNVADITKPNADGNYYTMHEDGVPKYTFDHIFADIGGIQVDEYRVAHSAANSDHQPVVAVCTVK